MVVDWKAVAADEGLGTVILPLHQSDFTSLVWFFAFFGDFKRDHAVFYVGLVVWGFCCVELIGFSNELKIYVDGSCTLEELNLVARSAVQARVTCSWVVQLIEAEAEVVALGHECPPLKNIISTIGKVIQNNSLQWRL
jgi:hypothetical protein